MWIRAVGTEKNNKMDRGTSLRKDVNGQVNSAEIIGWTSQLFESPQISAFRIKCPSTSSTDCSCISLIMPKERSSWKPPNLETRNSSKLKTPTSSSVWMTTFFWRKPLDRLSITQKLLQFNPTWDDGGKKTPKLKSFFLRNPNFWNNQKRPWIFS